MKKHTPPEQAVFLSREDCEGRLKTYFETFLKEQSDEVADVESLADYVGTTREGLFAMENSKEFGFALRKARNRIAKIKKQLAFQGKLPGTVLSFDLKNNHGYRDKNEEQNAQSEPVVIKGGAARNWAK